MLGDFHINLSKWVIDDDVRIGRCYTKLQYTREGQMNILLVEDHRLVADAMQIMLRQLGTEVSITACYSTQHALSILDENTNFQLILSDLLMPGIDGLGLLVGLQNRGVRVPLVLITGVEDERAIRAAYDNGAAGYISKSLPSIELINGLKRVLAGQRCFPDRSVLDDPCASNQNRPVSRTGIDSYTRKPGEKQLQVLRLMADGNSNKQISQIIGISEATVKYHTSQLFKLLSVKNRTSCVREAQNRGLLERYDTAS